MRKLKNAIISLKCMKMFASILNHIIIINEEIRQKKRINSLTIEAPFDKIGIDIKGS